MWQIALHKTKQKTDQSTSYWKQLFKSVKWVYNLQTVDAFTLEKRWSA
jgi:hypothetical protein